MKIFTDVIIMVFYSLIPYDDNREEDGLRLRENFIYEQGKHALILTSITIIVLF